MSTPMVSAQPRPSRRCCETIAVSPHLDQDRGEEQAGVARLWDLEDTRALSSFSTRHHEERPDEDVDGPPLPPWS